MRDDTISRQDAIMAVKMGALSAATLYGRTDEGSTALYETVRAIKALPAQPQRMKGKWTINDCHAAVYKYHCSECGANHRARYDFCPSCGADMREDMR